MILPLYSYLQHHHHRKHHHQQQKYHLQLGNSKTVNEKMELALQAFIVIFIWRLAINNVIFVSSLSVNKKMGQFLQVLLTLSDPSVPVPVPVPDRHLFLWGLSKTTIIVQNYHHHGSQQRYHHHQHNCILRCLMKTSVDIA